MQADVSEGVIIEQKQTIAKIDFLKISLLHENQVPSAAPAEAVVGKWWCPVIQNKWEGYLLCQPAPLGLSTFPEQKVNCFYSGNIFGAYF